MGEVDCVRVGPPRADQRAVREHAALRVRRGARRVEHGRDVVGAGAQRRLLHRLGRDAGAGRQEPLVGRQRPACRAEHDHVTEVRCGLECDGPVRLGLGEPRQGVEDEAGEVDVVGRLGGREEDGDLRARDDVRELAALEARVDRDDLRADERRREEGVDVLEAVRKEKADAPAGADVVREEAPRERARPVAQLAEGERCVRVCDRRAIGACRDLCLEQGRERVRCGIEVARHGPPSLPNVRLIEGPPPVKRAERTS